MKKTFGILFLVALISQLFLGNYRYVDVQAAHLDTSAATLAAGNIYRVKPGGATSTPCGGSWTDACELQTALSAAGSGDEIWVAGGTYTPTSGTDRTAAFQIKSGVEVYGGFDGDENSRDQRDPNPATNSTILSGDIGTTVDLSDNSYHVVTTSGTDSSALLDGFTITGGHANGTYPQNCGGGMYLDAGSPTLRNLTFSGNSAGSGGGMFNYNNSSPTLTEVTFNGNSANNYGGGMYNGYSSSPTLTNVTFSSNLASNYGGGMYNFDSSSPTLTNVTFSSNLATYSGGGMYNYFSSPTLTEVTFSYDSATYNGGGMYNSVSSPTLTEVTFNGNSANNYGGGMYNFDSSSPTLTNVTFSSNLATYSGGGMVNRDSSPTLTDVTFSGNSSGSEGGGMSIYNSSGPLLTDVTFNGNSAWYGGGMVNHDSSPTLTNVTFSGNSATYSGGGMYNGNSSSPTLRNTILWNNRDSSGTGTFSASIFNASSTVTLTHSLVQGSGGSDRWTSDPSYLNDGGNLDSDPLFVQSVDPLQAPTTSGDLHLGAGSPAIDAGDNLYVTTITTDLDGNPRISDGDGDGSAIVDMGAYEMPTQYRLTVSKSGTGSGGVSSSPAGITCPGDCSQTYDFGTLVTLTATAEEGSTFSGWSGACANPTGNCVVTMTQAQTVTANFTLNQYPLTVTTSGTGSGGVSSSPAGITCTGDCSQTYDFGTLVTLTATAEAGSSFSGWSGACTNASGVCTVTMTVPQEVTATFEAEELPIPPTGRFELFLPLTQRNH